MMSSNDLANVIEAYRKGATADMLQAETNGKWGVIWTIPPCSPNAMESAGRQFTRMHIRQIRHIRRAILKRVSGQREEIIILTKLPTRQQLVYSIQLGKPIGITRYLTDEALSALEAAYKPA